MRGAAVRYTKLGQLLKDGRDRKRLTLEQAALMLGLTNCHYLWRCELGGANFPARLLGRVCDLYDLNREDVLAVILEDFEESMRKFLEEK